MSDSLILGLIVFVSSLIGTFTGFGSSTIMVPLMLAFYPWNQTLFLAGIIIWFVDWWKVLLFRQKIDLKPLLWFALAGISFSWLGSQLTAYTQAWHLRLLGGVLVVIVIMANLKHLIKLSPNKRTDILGGSLSGLLAGLFGIGGPVRSVFLSNFPYSNSGYLMASGITGLLIDTTRILGYLKLGDQLTDQLRSSLWWLIIISFVGAKIAHSLNHHLSAKHYHLIVALLLIALGIHLMIAPAHLD